jgi:hypothetical protein
MLVKNAPFFVNNKMFTPLRVNIIKRSMQVVSMRIREVSEANNPEEFILYISPARLQSVLTNEVVNLSEVPEVMIDLEGFEHEASESGSYVYVLLDKPLPPVAVDWRQASAASAALKKLTGCKSVHLQW